MMQRIVLLVWVIANCHWTAQATDTFSFQIAKGQYFHQEPGAAPALRPYKPHFFEAKLVFTNSMTTVLQALVGTPKNPYFSFALFSPFYTYSMREDNLAALDTAFPNGVYKFYLSSTGPAVTNLLANGTFPAAPNLTNLIDAQAIDSTADFKLGWDMFAGGRTNDVICCSLRNSTGTVFQTSRIPGSGLNGTATSVLIPAGTLVPGRSYVGQLIFGSVQSATTNQTPGGLGLTSYQSQTDFYVKTIGPADNSPPRVYASIPAQGTIDVPTNSPVVIIFDRPMKTNGYSIGWVGSSDIRMVWNSEGTMFSLAPVINFPSNRVVNIILNSLPHPVFSDTNGNLLPPDTMITFTTGTRFHQPAAPVLNQPQFDGAGTFQAHLLAETNRGCVLQFSTNLTVWTSFMTNTAFGGLIHFSDTNAMGRRFYRAIAY